MMFLLAQHMPGIVECIYSYE